MYILWFLKQEKLLQVCAYKCLSTCAGLLGAAQAFADRALHASSSGPAQSLAEPVVLAHSTGLSGCIPQASGQAGTEEVTYRP